MIYTIETKSFMGVPTKTALAGAAIGAIGGGIGGRLIDKGAKREGSWIQRNKGLVIGSVGGAGLGAGIGYGLGKMYESKMNALPSKIQDKKDKLLGEYESKSLDEYNKYYDSEYDKYDHRRNSIYEKSSLTRDWDEYNRLNQENKDTFNKNIGTFTQNQRKEYREFLDNLNQLNQKELNKFNHQSALTAGLTGVGLLGGGIGTGLIVKKRLEKNRIKNQSL